MKQLAARTMAEQWKSGQGSYHIEEATAGKLCAVWGSAVHEGWWEVEDSPVEDSPVDGQHLTHGERLRELGLFSLAKRVIQR